MSDRPEATPTSSVSVPLTVSRDEMWKALEPFLRLLGIEDKNYIYAPLVIEGERITFFSVVEPGIWERSENPPADAREFGNEASQLAYAVTVEVA